MATATRARATCRPTSCSNAARRSCRDELFRLAARKLTQPGRARHAERPSASAARSRASSTVLRPQRARPEKQAEPRKRVRAKEALDRHGRAADRDQPTTKTETDGRPRQPPLRSPARSPRTRWTRPSSSTVIRRVRDTQFHKFVSRRVKYKAHDETQRPAKPSATSSRSIETRAVLEDQALARRSRTISRRPGRRRGGLQ